MRTGPITQDTTTVALGLAEIRIGNSAAYIGQRRAILPATASIGALANTKFIGNAEFFKLESGFPLVEDTSFPLRESAALECAFKEITPANVALSRGLDPDNYANAHSGEIYLGTITTPSFIRMEAIYTYPDGTNTMKVIFPRAQVTSTTEIDFATEDVATVPVVITSKSADDGVSGGNKIWNGCPLGMIIWDDGTGTTTSTTSSSSSSSTTTSNSSSTTTSSSSSTTSTM